jgi:hypothetical protein
MPQELGYIPEVVVGNITGGEVVLRDVTYEINNPAIDIRNPTIPIKPPSDAIPITPSKPEQANERMVLFDRVNLNYITAQPSDGLDMMSRNPQIEFVGSFDRATAEYVADELAASPPGNALEIKAKQVPALLSELVVTQSVLQSAAELLSAREIVLRKLIEAKRLLPNPTPEQMFDVAKKINDAARTLSPVQIDPNYGVTDADIAASQSQTSPAMPIMGENIPAEEVVFSQPLMSFMDRKSAQMLAQTGRSPIYLFTIETPDNIALEQAIQSALGAGGSRTDADSPLMTSPTWKYRTGFFDPSDTKAWYYQQGIEPDDSGWDGTPVYVRVADDQIHSKLVTLLTSKAFGGMVMNWSSRMLAMPTK